MRRIILCVCLFMGVAFIHDLCYAETVSRCNEGLIKSDYAQSLKELTNKLKQDAFSEAFGVFVRDLEQLDRSLQNVVTKWNTFLSAKCRPHNAKTDEYEAAVRIWNSSRCVVGPITEEQAPGCNARKGELDVWQARIQSAHALLSNEAAPIERELQGVIAQSTNPVLNAQNVLNPDNTEQALRLYTWYMLRKIKSGALNSCQAFALIADKLGERVSNQDLFIAYLSRGFIELGHPVHMLVGDPPFRPMAGDTFDASGFKAMHYKGSTENQVRHAAGYLAVGYRLGVDEAVLISLRYDIAKMHPEVADFRLAMYAAHLGFRLKHGPLRTSNFGEAMRKEFCE